VTPSACVIYNPAAGRGQARRLFDEVQRRLGNATFRASERPGHAVELARKAALDGFARIVAAGGDGTVHQVANGVLLSGREVVFSVVPVGSSNDYAHALGLDSWWKEPKGRGSIDTLRADVGVVRWAGRERYFVNGVGFGFNGMVTVESLLIRSLRGLPLYATAFLRSMVRHFATPDLTMTLDGKESHGPTLALSVSLGVREGGFPLFRAARLDDGWFETLHVGRVRRWELLRYLPAMMTGNLPTDHPAIRAGRCASAVVRSATPLCVHADGEMVCVPSDGVREVEVELLPARLLVESYRAGAGK
jgi:diacylglycerol kinase (ATP)